LTILYYAVHIIIAVIIVGYLLGRLILSMLGKEDIRVDTSAPFTVVEKDSEHITLKKRLPYHNEGGSCATIMDAFNRIQLPYEQFDGIEARGKAEREGEVRTDDYFEAVLIQKKGDKNGEDKLNIDALVTLRPRGKKSLAEALSEMTGKNVDLAMDFIWMETGRTPWHYRKIRLEIGALELAKLAGVTPKES
jgi:hypothetical protein